MSKITRKWIELTLTNNGCLRAQDIPTSNNFSIQTVLDNHIGSGGFSHQLATPSTHGFMSSQDKQKLDGIEAGAQVNTVTSVAGKTGNVILTANDIIGLNSKNDTNIIFNNQLHTSKAFNVINCVELSNNEIWFYFLKAAEIQTIQLWYNLPVDNYNKNIILRTSVWTVDENPPNYQNPDVTNILTIPCSVTNKIIKHFLNIQIPNYGTFIIVRLNREEDTYSNVMQIINVSLQPTIYYPELIPIPEQNMATGLPIYMSLRRYTIFTNNVNYTITGNLPTGLTVNSDGIISGIPENVESTNILVKAISQNGVSQRNVTFNIVNGNFDYGTLPDGNAEATYIDYNTFSNPYYFHADFGYDENTPPSIYQIPVQTMAKGLPYQLNLNGYVAANNYSWLPVEGSLPSGLSFNTEGIILGTPSISGMSTVIISVTNENGYANREITFNIVECDLDYGTFSEPNINATSIDYNTIDNPTVFSIDL